MKSGFVSIIGRSKVGKSTLLNALVGQKIAIISDKSRTTRHIIQGIYNEPDYQIVFNDTPGIQKPVSKLERIMNQKAYLAMKNVDIVLFVIDTKAGLGRGDKQIIRDLTKLKAPVILVLNKIDLVSDEELLLMIAEYKDLYPFAEIVPVSALNSDNLTRLLTVIKKYLTDEVKYFNQDLKTSNSEAFMVAEIVREQIIKRTVREVPQAITCQCSSLEFKKDVIYIVVDIIVDRETLKKIVIGKNGWLLKEIGTASRIVLEEIYHQKVYLELNVKTIKDWKNKEKWLTELGFQDFKLK